MQRQAGCELGQPQALVDLLNAFFEYTEPNIQGFDEAVDEFKERVPELAKAMAEIITGRGPKPGNNVRAFDAREVIDRLGPSIVTPQ